MNAFLLVGFLVDREGGAVDPAVSLGYISCRYNDTVAGSAIETNEIGSRLGVCPDGLEALLY